eukprot:gene13235-15642_t
MAQNPKVLQQVSELEYEESETGSLASEEDSIPLLNLDPNCSKSTNQLLATETPPAAHPWVPSRAGPEANSRIRTIRWLAPSSVLCALLVFGIAVLTLLRGEASEQKQKQMTTAKDPSTDPIVLTDTLVNIPDGTLDGAETDNSFEFLGVPYAESPTGDLRWRPPLQVAPWGGVRSAKRLGSSCWQYYRSISIPQDEDCLFLNVFVPKANARAAASRHGADAHEPLPVMVWIHGGGFVYGSSSNKEYNGTNILKLNKGVIVVTINYRLGVFGYGGNAALQARDASNTTGNYGQQDQREALRWVQRNIAAFGGDPLRVTLFGQSSGAASISLHLVTPGSWGLFDRAILESGSYPAWTALSAEATWHNLDLVARKSRCDVPAELGFNSTLDCLLSLSGEDLNRHQRVPVPCRDGCNWGATVDGVELPDYPWWLAWGGKIAPGKQVLHGTTRDDGSQFVDIPYKATEEDLVGYWKQQFGDAPGYTSDEVVARLHELYPAAKHKHAGGGMYSPHFMAAAESETDFAYRCAAQWTSQAMAQAKVSVYEYLWSFCEGSCVYFVEHSSEIPYVFNYNAKRMNPFEIQMSRDIIELWTAFATAGNPNDGRLNHWYRGNQFSSAIYHLNFPNLFGMVAVVIDLDELPEDVNDILEILQAEQAPLGLWLEFAKAYLRQGKEENFKAILEDGSSLEIEEYYADSTYERIRIFIALSEYYIRLGRKSDKRKKEDYFQRAAVAISAAAKISQAEMLPVLAKGQLAFVRGNLDEAERLFDQASQRKDNGSDSILGALGKACVLFNKNSFQASLTLYEAILKMHPGCPAVVRLGIALCHFKLKNYDSAKPAFKRVLQLDPRSVDAYVGLAVTEMNSGAPGSPQRVEGIKEALKRLAEAFSLDPNNASVLKHLANHFLIRDEYDKVQQLAQSAFHATEVPSMRAEACYLIARASHAKVCHTSVTLAQ